MAEYRVLIPKQAGKRLDNLPRDVLRRIYRRLKDLEADPRPSWATQLRGEPPGWRFRVGAYRVLYEIDDEDRSVVIRDAGHRREIYRRR